MVKMGKKTINEKKEGWLSGLPAATHLSTANGQSDGGGKITTATTTTKTTRAPKNTDSDYYSRNDSGIAHVLTRRRWDRWERTAAAAGAAGAAGAAAAAAAAAAAVRSSSSGVSAGVHLVCATGPPRRHRLSRRASRIGHPPPPIGKRGIPGTEPTDRRALATSNTGAATADWRPTGSRLDNPPGWTTPALPQRRRSVMGLVVRPVRRFDCCRRCCRWVWLCGDGGAAAGVGDGGEDGGGRGGHDASGFRCEQTTTSGPSASPSRLPLFCLRLWRPLIRPALSLSLSLSLFLFLSPSCPSVCPVGLLFARASIPFFFSFFYCSFFRFSLLFAFVCVVSFPSLTMCHSSSSSGRFQLNFPALFSSFS